MNTALILAGTSLAAALLGGCASNTTPAPYAYSAPASTEYGTIESIQATRVAAGTSGTGAVVGGVLGALAGNQIGSGSGRTAATVAGAAGGALVGNQMEANRAQARDAYQVVVRLDDGSLRTLVQDSVADLRIGGRVRVADGRAYRY